MTSWLWRAEELGASALRAYGRAIYPWTHLWMSPLAARLFDMTSEGHGYVPRRGPAIITPNHLSFVDPIAIALVLPRRVTFLGKIEYANSWTSRWLVELAGVIPVDRDDAIKAEGSLRAGVEVLRRGELLGLFPEGTRTPDGRLFKGKTGAARMALDVGCPVIPAGLTGTDKVLPKDARMPKLTKVTVKFGPPMRVPDEARDDPHLLRVFTDELMSEIARLSGQTYRHRYAYQKKTPSGSWDVAGTFT